MLTNISCTNSANKNAETGDHSKTDNFQEGSFGYDLNFLKKHDSVIVLTAGDAQIIVSPKYQAKVFTSTAEGNEGPSFGWVHYKAFDSVDAHMNAYGGENRIWLGPEGGKLYCTDMDVYSDRVASSKTWPLRLSRTCPRTTGP
jgi:hypothetical protein